MTFEEFWKQSGWHRPGEDPEVMGGAEYNLALDAWAAALASVGQSLPAAICSCGDHCQADGAKCWNCVANLENERDAALAATQPAAPSAAPEETR